MSERSRVTVEVEIEYPAVVDKAVEPHRTGNMLVMGVPWLDLLPEGFKVVRIQAQPRTPPAHETTSDVPPEAS